MVRLVEEAVVAGADLAGREAMGNEFGQAEASGRDEVEDGAGVAGDGSGMSPGRDYNLGLPNCEWGRDAPNPPPKN